MRDFTAMNTLAEKYGDKVNILAFPCNQFGHQTNEGNEEFLNTLKYVRPGNDFALNENIKVFEKVNVNGADSHPLFKWMRETIKIPMGEDADTAGNGCADEDALILPRGGFGGTTISLWTPVTRSDIAWNFEKFLIAPDGSLSQRYHRYFLVDDIASDIDSMLE